jgi:hypothetical protein
MTIKTLAIAAVFIGAAMGTGTVEAVTVSKTVFIDPSSSCQLSLPTIDTSVRPRATGYRNEGATNAFVICGATYIFSSATVTSAQVQLTAFDGGNHDVSCTAVNRGSGGGSEIYSTKVISLTGGGGSASWTGTDLNSFVNFAVSVTCNLPTGVAVTGLRLVVPDEVGA